MKKGSFLKFGILPSLAFITWPIILITVSSFTNIKDQLTFSLLMLGTGFIGFTSGIYFYKDFKSWKHMRWVERRVFTAFTTVGILCSSLGIYGLFMF